MVKRNKIIYSVIAIVISLTVAFYSCKKTVAYLTTEETAENIISTNELPDWLYYLPASAKNISYWKLPFYCTTYEYEVVENDFLKWAEINEIPLTEINGVSEVFRYSRHFTSYPDSNDPNEIAEYDSKRMTKTYNFMKKIFI